MYNRKLEEGGDYRRSRAGQDDDPFGIDFNKWEENLKAIEKENKLLVRYNEDKARKEEKVKKEEEKKVVKEEETKVYEQNAVEVGY